MQAPINLYFDVTPLGRIQTRFTKDLGAVEGDFYMLLQQFLTLGFKMLNVMILVVCSAPNILFVILFMCYRLVVMGL